ncbi:hypothetical protein QE109_01875 [Fusibacter bizertensis]|uniref:Uncharacterized protein n=1 Tax=Fusibacter bizertensis TaxID=1488331 RepID=A0ABT6N8Z1_9FIRM|nr:hypothetical protein [Fusibacter bizertensis]MDH8676873.1 hypothetical protein [Fusibacter bizertensis]
MAEQSEAQFVIAIEDVTRNTLDRDDVDNNAMYGTKKAAEMYYELLKEIDFNQDWWKLAYDLNDEFVGLVVP